MSLKSKLISLVTMICLVAGILIVGIFAAQQQTLTMTGNVQFNINDRSLYVKQVRIKQDNSSAEPQVVSDFMPGYINGEFNMNIGEYDNSLGSFALYFDIINATDDEWEITNVTLSEQLQAEQVSVTYSGIIETNDIAEKDDNGYKIFDPETTDIDGSLILVVTAPNSSSINLSGITITLNVYIPPVLEGFTFDNNGTLLAYTGSDTEVVIPSSYSIIEGEPTDKTLEFSSYNDFLIDLTPNQTFYISLKNFTVDIDEISYGPYADFTIFFEGLMNGELGMAMQTASSIRFNYQDGGSLFVEGDDYLVTAIGGLVFYNNTNIQKIVLPSGLKTIGDNAFEFCSGLTGDLVIPEGVTYIGGCAFSDCDGLTGKLEIPEGVTYIGDSAFSNCSGFTGGLIIPEGVTSIGESTFSGCSGFTGKLEIPERVTSIGNYAFNGCSGFTELDLNKCTNLASIGEFAFRSCTGFTGELIIPEGVTNIEDYTFSSCDNLTSIIFPLNLKSIGNYAFSWCYELTGKLIIPKGVTSIGNAAFTNCRELTEVDLSQCSSLASIGSSVFSGCSGLTEVDLSNCTSLASIGDYTFSSCDNLTSIILPLNLKNIGDYAFSGCTSLTTIRIEATTPPTISGTTIPSTITVDTIEVPLASVDAYKSADGWSTYADKIVGY